MLKYLKKYGQLGLKLLVWLKINSAQITLLAGMALIAVAAFLIQITLGLSVSGVFLIVIAVISIISERG